MLKALKVLVIVMAVIIAAGLAALGYGIYQNAKKLDLGPKISTPQSRFSEKTLPIPTGCQIAEMKPDGARLYVRLQSAQSPDHKCSAILVIDTATGKTIGSLKAEP
jgi:hypothetical protein